MTATVTTSELELNFSDLATTEFARVSAAGQLAALPAPSSTFSTGGWLIEDVTPDGFAALGSTRPDTERLALWNPLTGRLISYFDGSKDGLSLLGYDIWP